MPEVESAAETATGVHVSEGTEGAVKEADEHTPATPVPPAESKVDPTAAHGGDDLRDVVTSLADTVKVLTDKVMNLETPDAPTDKVPFLLRGKKDL